MQSEHKAYNLRGMSIITTDEELRAFCVSVSSAPYITIDTEFLREKTYYPILCLFQISAPGVDAVAFDPIANPDLDFEPLFELLFDPDLIKVCHAGKQDMEIIFDMTGRLPHPVFDTQIAAMVCGLGDQIGYDNLIRKTVGIEVDKSSQFTDWSRRPLTDKQLQYALNDVTYLRDAYEKISGQLESTGRLEWVQEELMALTDVSAYTINEDALWQRIKMKSNKPHALACLKKLAVWRETEARKRNVPKNRIVKDDALADIAIHRPKNREKLSRTRNLYGDQVKKHGDTILQIIAEANALDKSECPQPKAKKNFPSHAVPIFEMLRMLLKIQCAENDVAPKLVANQTDLEAIAMDDKADVPAMHGWRYKIFGQHALDIKHGRLGLTLENGEITLIKTKCI